MCIRDRFCDYAVPQGREVEDRKQAIKEVTAVAKTHWPECEVYLFGSFATGLSLATSDVDLSVMVEDGGDSRSLIRKFNKELQRAQVAAHSLPIFSAKVPILKIVKPKTGIHMDISFNAPDGYCAVKPIKQLCDKYPPLKLLAITMKAFLRQKGLNDTHIGGIGSFLLVVLITAFLQFSAKEGQEEKTLGELLVGLLSFYGEDFNYRKLGISIVGDGMLFNKPCRNDSLTVENPQDPDVDIGKSVREYENIAKEFIAARDALKKSNMALSSIIKPIPTKKKLKLKCLFILH
eukprot:TRINITY_DN2215_c0_g2_i5.p1 TRINITY_DN2215_c0_g2~~TRINITY_DN2215_c0_g2_i5.p1  ORF type:complete len:306 (+),score=80.66 TRINITY_DN2215_c0_g2_i5:48-920(+)